MTVSFYLGVITGVIISAVTMTSICFYYLKSDNENIKTEFGDKIGQKGSGGDVSN